MAEYRILPIFWVMVLSLLVLTPSSQAEYEYIDINNPFLRKIPLAAPYFKSISGSPEEVQLGAEAAQLLSETLEFTGYFKILDRDGFLSDPQRDAILLSEINFQNWTGIGAELLVTGGLVLQDNLVQMELRLFDTFKAQLLVGKRYKGWTSDKRQIIRRFCSEIIYRLTGNWGVFDSKIAFLSNGTGNKEIYVCDFDGYNPIQLTRNKAITLFPAWSSDGQWMAYTSYVKGKPDLYIKHLREKRGTVVTKEGINSTPAWVPGQFALAATLSFSGDPEIYLLTGDGKIIKRITKKWGIDDSPTWSPDGKNMAFVSNRSGTPQIYIREMASGVEQRLTFEGRYNTQPSWSPAGDKIAYSAMKNGQINVKVIDVEGNHPMSLTHDQGNNEAPTWSPDGSLIVFSSTREGAARIYVMTAYGTDQRRLLALSGQQTNPSWSPRMLNR